MTATANASATLLPSNPISGEVTVNEGFWKFDWTFGGRLIQDMTLKAPLASTTEGHAYIVAASASGAWLARDDEVAHYFSSSWHFYTPVQGMTVMEASSFVQYYWNGTAWAVYASAP